MSQSTTKGKVIGRFTIGFDDETKAAIADLKAKLDAVPHCMGFGNVMPIGGLLAAMQDTAANDSNGAVHHGENVKPELKQLGQWVFEGQDAKWISAAVNTDGRAYLHNMPKGMMYFNHSSYGWCSKRFDIHEMQLIEGSFNPSGFAVGFIERETVNDVDYLSESVPTIQDMNASEIIIDECNWLLESAPQITQADMQLIFIKNLSECLIQRMHSMNRFSEDDYAIGGDKLMPWDIIFDDGARKFGLITALQRENLAAVFFQRCSDYNFLTDAHGFHQDSLIGKCCRTITEAELPAFRAALEACYA